MGTNVDSLMIAKARSEIAIIPKMANRHGLIAGATGTGKTITLRTMAERFSAIGVPVFMADVKGDLSGLPFPGGETPKVRERIEQLASRISFSKGSLWPSGTSSGSRVIRSAPPFPKWVLSSSAGS